MATPDSPDGSVKWSEIDKIRFYGIGTGLYSCLTAALHPVIVVKVRQQVLNASTSATDTAPPRAHQQSASSIVRESLSSPQNARTLFRGLPVVLTLAVPARVVYIGVLENSREGIGDALTRAVAQADFGPDEAHALIATVSGGAAGGLAAMSAQMIIVPMDVVSQRQMVMDNVAYEARGTASAVVRSIIRTEGLGGLFAGFGLSLFSSLPTGSVWWATYAGCQVWIRHYLWPPLSSAKSLVEVNNSDTSAATESLKKLTMQLTSGLGAAVVASSLTMPLDTVKTRLQVQKGTSNGGSSYMEVTRILYRSSGVPGFYRGLGPRIAHMGLWGTILSSAYELLRHVSRKDYQWNDA
uniref:Mitochondrial carrier protein n=1 Tax=Odontella aurita TaxID=265563 RepID=A0A7S4NDE0_9STRA|mmetsp:Transcript_58139/g.173511  ORF Transcript_58139/g.173511 Transcript_58139/m.173511 type:complete len:353 (+) Transcript_58139:106-1164(+)